VGSFGDIIARSPGPEHSGISPHNLLT
jgi:hypothetical protein